ncbi:MAG: ADOP family duplicated permease [Gemmatimonas sp.]
MPAPFRLPFLKSQVERDLDRELAHHIDLKTDALIKLGHSPEDARREAERLFGDQRVSRAECLDIDMSVHQQTRRRNALAEFVQDATFAFRALRHSAQSTAAMIGILALGIGATTAVFTLYDAVVLKPLAAGDATRLVWITNSRNDATDTDVTTGAYFAWRNAARSVEQMSTVATTSATLLDDIGPARLEGGVLGQDFIRALDVRAALGRTFADRDFDAAAEPTVMLAPSLWRTRFNADPSVVGRRISLDGVQRLVIGVLPESADLFDDGLQFWLPSKLSLTSADNFTTPRLQVIGKLRPGATIASAESELSSILAQADTRPERAAEPVGAKVTRLDAQLSGPFRSRLQLVFAAVACVLAVGCANVASLLLVRGVARQRELAIRASLGASRGRLVRQLLTENTLMAVAAGALGIVAGQSFLAMLRRVLPEGIPHLESVSINMAAVLFALVVTFACSVFVGLIPALRVSRVDVRTTMQNGARGTVGGRDRLRRALMIAEVGVATLLLVTAGLLTRSAVQLDRVPLGFSADDVLTARVSLPRERYGSPDAVITTQTRLLEELRNARGKSPVALVSRIPLVSLGISYDFGVTGRPADRNENVNGAIVLASSGYFDVMRMRLVTGRDFDGRDRTGSPRVAIVNEAMAKRLGLGDRVVGARITGLGGSFNDRAGNAAPWEIVGVAADTRDWGSRNSSRPQVYLPYAQTPDEIWEWTNRTSVIVAQRAVTEDGAYATSLKSLQGAVERVDPTLPLYDVLPMRTRIESANATERAYMTLLLALGATALILAAAGIYAMIAYAVRQRVPEIGVRVALGATPSHVLGLVLRWTLGATSVGVALGLVFAFGASRVLGTLLFGVSATDALTFAGAALVMVATAVATSIVPARRALAIAPDQALRSDG